MVNVLKLQTLYSIFFSKVSLSCCCFLKYLVEWQTVKTLIRLQEQSDLGLQCLHMPFYQKLSFQKKKKKIKDLEEAGNQGSSSDCGMFQLERSEFMCFQNYHIRPIDCKYLY